MRLTLIAIARELPQAQLWQRGAFPWALGAAIGLALAGGALALAGLLEFRRARTSVNPLAREKASVLVTTSVFGITRNPMHLGMLLVLAGWAVYLGNAAAWVALPLFVLRSTRFRSSPRSGRCVSALASSLTSMRGE